MKLIVEMEMPKNCYLCPMAHYNKLDEFTGCEFVAGKLFAATRDKAYAESTFRPDWCPIKGELVSCGECIMGIEENGEKYCGGEYHKLDWFCADGERKDGERKDDGTTLD